MRLGKSVERLAKSMFFAPAILARYGTLRPTRVHVHGSANAIHIDPSDARARIKFIRDPIRGRVTPPLRFWRVFNAHLRPDIALDVGVNFGECLFGTDYADHTLVFGVEANPLILPFLEKSRAEHPAGARMHLLGCLVSDAPAHGVPFYVDTQWSGNSSATTTHKDAAGVRRFEVHAECLDALIPAERSRDATMLFKMDIEGYECLALRGFKDTLASVRLAVGFVEFDSKFTASAGVAPEDYVASLLATFEVYRIDSSGSDRLVQIGSFDELPRSRAVDGRVHTDLVLVTKGASKAAWMPPGWSVQTEAGGPRG